MPSTSSRLNHLPSGRLRPSSPTTGPLEEQLVTTKTLRRRFFSLAGRLTRSARRLTLHLPQGWPWENQFSRVARFRALPLPS